MANILFNPTSSVNQYLTNVSETWNHCWISITSSLYVTHEQELNKETRFKLLIGLEEESTKYVGGDFAKKMERCEGEEEYTRDGK